MEHRGKTLGLVLSLAVSSFTLMMLSWILSTGVAQATSCDVPTQTHTSIQSAVDDPGCDIINLVATEYFENVDITRNVTIQGQDSETTTVNGGFSGRVITIQPGLAVTLTRMTIVNGAAETWGGGILNENALLTVDAVAILSNTVEGLGGGISNVGGNISIINSKIAGNRADRWGGGVFNGHGGTMLISNTVVSGNNAPVAYGGGIYGGTGDGSIFSGCAVRIVNSTISSNYADYGGGIISIQCSLVIEQSTLVENGAINWGGGILNADSNVTLTNSTLSANRAYGGGSGKGGGIYSQLNGTVEILNSTLNGNSASVAGGAIYNFSGSTITVTNSIVANSSRGGDCAFFAPIVSLGHNIASDSSCNLTDISDLPDTIPLLGPLRNNGGPTETHALLTGSPAIDNGDDTACPSTDQRGYPRPTDGNNDQTPVCDIGAYERPEYSTLVYLPLALRRN